MHRVTIAVNSLVPHVFCPTWSHPHLLFPLLHVIACVNEGIQWTRSLSLVCLCVNREQRLINCPCFIQQLLELVPQSENCKGKLDGIMYKSPGRFLFFFSYYYDGSSSVPTCLMYPRSHLIVFDSLLISILDISSGSFDIRGNHSDSFILWYSPSSWHISWPNEIEIGPQ